MDRPTKTIDMPISGCNAEVITYWTYGEEQELAKMVVGDLTIDPMTKTTGQVRADVAFERNRRVLDMAVIKITMPGGQELPKTELYGLPAPDIKLITDHLASFDEEKKSE